MVGFPIFRLVPFLFIWFLYYTWIVFSVQMCMCVCIFVMFVRASFCVTNKKIYYLQQQQQQPKPRSPNHRHQNTHTRSYIWIVRHLKTLVLLFILGPKIFIYYYLFMVLHQFMNLKLFFPSYSYFFIFYLSWYACNQFACVICGTTLPICLFLYTFHLLFYLFALWL